MQLGVHLGRLLQGGPEFGQLGLELAEMIFRRLHHMRMLTFGSETWPSRQCAAGNSMLSVSLTISLQQRAQAE